MSILIALAGLMGAGGIWLSAAGAHALPNAKLDVAGAMLLVHAAAVIGGAAAGAQGLALRPLALFGCALLIAGSALFAGDIAFRAYAGTRLFPFAAPAGGFILIGGWIAVGIAGLIAAIR